MGQTTHFKIFDGWQDGLFAAAFAGVPVGMLLATVPDSRGMPTVALVLGMMAGALLLVATLTFYLHWLAAPRPHHGWMACAMVVLGSQVLVGSGIGLAGENIGVVGHQWASFVDVVVTAVALVLVVLSARGARVPDPLLLGLGLAMALTGLQVAEFFGPSLTQPSAVLGVTVLLTILIGHVCIARLVWRDRDLPRWARRRLAVTISLIGAAHVARSSFLDNAAADLAAAMVLVGAASLWTSATFVLLRRALADQRRRAAGLEGSLLEIETSWRGSREQLHEIRSTVAGAASASRLLGDDALGAEVHARLERSIQVELGRLERLMGEQPPSEPGPVDVDATVDALLTAHRARGRAITWEPSGAAVHARPDDVAEALNILLDNAATHGGTASTIAVTHADNAVEIAVSDEGPGVPAEARDEIFDWGVHSTDSPGQGIGLNLARRLVSAHGGSLTLADLSTRGSSFVIRLPAARRSEENHVRDYGHSA